MANRNGQDGISTKEAIGAPGEQRGETPSDLCEICFKDVVGCICKPPKPLTQEARPLPADFTDEDMDRVEKETAHLVREGLIQRICELEAQLSRQESAEDAWKRGVRAGWGMATGTVLRENWMPSYAPPISPDKWLKRRLFHQIAAYRPLLEDRVGTEFC